MSCHEPPAPTRTMTRPTWTRGGANRTPGAVVEVALPVVALLGNPNVGKSTLFNTLTGARQQVVNAPGTTVELTEGSWRPAGTPVRLVDLPGTYSLLARSPDELVAARAVGAEDPAEPGLMGGLEDDRPHGRGGPARPMHGDGCSCGAETTGAVPPASDDLVADLVVLVAEAPGLARGLYLLGQAAAAGRPAVVALTMLDVAASRGLAVDTDRLSAELGVPVVAVDPRSGAGTDRLAAAVLDALADRPTVRVPPACTDPDELTRADALFTWVDGVHAASVPGREAVHHVRTWSDRVDRVLLHPWAGVPVFLAVMWALFQLATAVAAPLMAAVQQLVTGPLSDAVRAVLPAGFVSGLVVDGFLAGVGTVLSFAPLMALMFVAIAVLEDSGYLARAAFVADRAMRLIGLDGRAVLPLVVGFGCNVPAMSATRTLPHARQRLLTGLLIPYASCSARLTVYILLATVFFPGHAGTAIFLMYVASIALVVVGGLALRATAFRDLRREPFVLALPAYQRPRVKPLALSAWVRTRAFVVKAGRIIVATLTVVWLLMAVPVTGHHAVGDVPVEDSLYGRVAAGVAPVMEPAGVGSWQTAAALVTGFVAKEVVVGSFAQSLAVTEPADPAHPGDLGAQLRATFDETSGGHSGAAAAALMVFVLAYTPCLATVAEQRRLFGTRWALGAVAVQLVVAWLAAVAVFQVAARL